MHDNIVLDFQFFATGAVISCGFGTLLLLREQLFCLGGELLNFSNIIFLVSVATFLPFLRLDGAWVVRGREAHFIQDFLVVWRCLVEEVGLFVCGSKPALTRCVHESRLALTITAVTVRCLFRILLALMDVENLPEVAVEFSEIVFELFVEKDPLHVPVVLESLVKFGQQIQLHVAALSLGSAVATVNAHYQHRRSLGLLRFCWNQHLEETENARVKQVALGLVAEEDLQDRIENLFFDHVAHRQCVLRLDDRLKELHHLDISLDRFVQRAVRHFHQHFVAHKEGSKLEGIYVINDQLVEELQDQDPALVNVPFERKCHSGVGGFP